MNEQAIPRYKREPDPIVEYIPGVLLPDPAAEYRRAQIAEEVLLKRYHDQGWQAIHNLQGLKASVYRQLQQSVDDRRTVRSLEFDYAALSGRRRQLNQVERA